MACGIDIGTLLVIVRKEFENGPSGHDYPHTERVWKTARAIAEREGGDMELTEAAALLHDIADHKFHGGDSEAGPARASEVLRLMGAEESFIEAAAQIIREVSFKGAKVDTRPSTLEGQIVQDADRLDAIGAIGIARAFSYGGSKNRPLYDPEIPPVLHEDFEAYKNAKSHTVNHFYEKLLLLRGMMNTRTGKKLADLRHRRMEVFLKDFLSEWNCEDLPPAPKRKLKSGPCYVYLLSMENGSLYTGYTNDPSRRLAEHRSGKSKYTRAFGAKDFAGCWKVEAGQAEAMKIEAFVKKQSRARKDEFVERPEALREALEKAWKRAVDVTAVKNP